MSSPRLRLRRVCACFASATSLPEQFPATEHSDDCRRKRLTVPWKLTTGDGLTGWVIPSLRQSKEADRNPPGFAKNLLYLRELPLKQKENIKGYFVSKWQSSAVLEQSSRKQSWSVPLGKFLRESSTGTSIDANDQ